MNDIEELTERIQDQTNEIRNMLRIRDRYTEKANHYAQRAVEIAEEMQRDITILEAYMALEGVDLYD